MIIKIKAYLLKAFWTVHSRSIEFFGMSGGRERASQSGRMILT
jgi:hypothetical protein